MTSVPLLLSQAHPCSYLDEQAQSLFVSPDYPLTDSAYAQLLAQGFRRSGGHAYRPHCRSCSACVPVRIPVQDFQPNRSQRRIWEKHRTTRVIPQPAAFKAQHYQLYCRYQQHRHAGGGMADSTPDDYLQFLASGWGSTWFVEFHIDDALAAVAVVDRVDNALSAVYTFFDPRFAASSPGVFAVLWQVRQALDLGLPYVYLGFWIGECRKMAYKSNYRPLQALLDGEWRTFGADAALPGLW